MGANVPSWLGVPSDLPGALLAARDTLSRIELLVRSIESQISPSNEPDAPPDLIDLGPGNTNRTHVRYRTKGIVFSGGTVGDVFALMVGSRQLIRWIANASPVWVPVPEQTIDRGADVSVVDVTTPAATNYEASLSAGVE